MIIIFKNVSNFFNTSKFLFFKCSLKLFFKLLFYLYFHLHDLVFVGIGDKDQSSPPLYNFVSFSCHVLSLPLKPKCFLVEFYMNYFWCSNFYLLQISKRLYILIITTLISLIIRHISFHGFPQINTNFDITKKLFILLKRNN